MQMCDVGVLHSMKTYWKEVVCIWKQDHNFQKVRAEEYCFSYADNTQNFSTYYNNDFKATVVPGIRKS